MRSFIESSYSGVLKNIFKAVNPIKKQLIKTECLVHKHINIQGIEILKNDGFMSVYNFMSVFIRDINQGAVWADQDFKSSNHFYSPHIEKGLFGCSNAQNEFEKYYNEAIINYKAGNVRKGMFYFGAACHLIQDMTVPQHVNRKLLDKHRRYEQWVIKTYNRYDSFKVNDGGIYLKDASEYIEYNSRIAMEAYYKYYDESNINTRFFNITSVILVAAQRTTAGIMKNFYNDIAK